MPAGGAALVFPPLWYYVQVPADLLSTGSFLRARGVPVACHDLSAGFLASLLGDEPGWRALRDEATYRDPAAYQAADAGVRAALQRLPIAPGVHFSFRELRFLDIDEGDVPAALAAGLSSRNPALPYLRAQVPRILADDPALVAVALGHPDQIVQLLCLGRLLRQAGYRGWLVLYGSHEDVVTPEDLIEDLIEQSPGEPRHLLFDDYDAVIAGEAEGALLALWQARQAGPQGPHRPPPLPGVYTPGAPLLRVGPIPRPDLGGLLDLRDLPVVDPTLIDPTRYPFPAPVVDLRLSRSCPYGRCAFCAITHHQSRYRARPLAAARADMQALHDAFGSRFFFFRDDLLTPRQLRELGGALSDLRGFRPRFAARARFEPGLSAAILESAAAAGLGELWLGLEAASERVRALMDKGVKTAEVERILREADDAGIRLRPLCLLGFPGETLAEARETLAFLERHCLRLSSAALSPFQLMRQSPVYRDPARYGLRIVPDPVPRHRRLRFSARAEGDLLPPDRTAALVDEGIARLGGWFAGRWEGPTLFHAFLRAELSQGH